MASRSLKDLQPHFAEKAAMFEVKCRESGIDVLIYCTLRSNAEQNGLYDQGRKEKGAIVTNARGGESYHNYGLAFDCVPTVGGKPMWSDKDTYSKMGAIGESIGMVWAGRWTGSLRETAHFQDSNTPISELKSKWPNGWEEAK